MKYKVKMTVLCEVSVWGSVEAGSIGEATSIALEIGTNSGGVLDHEIVSDVRTLTVDIKEAV